MIPSISAFPKQNLKIVNQPTNTYKINLQNNQVYGGIDGKEAMIQAIYKILSTERYQYVIYSWNYGIELADLYGEAVSYVYPELERRITEALTWDHRIKHVDNFKFDSPNKGEVCVSFMVHTIFGAIELEKVVNF